jgi:acylphosphatase
MLRRVIYYSGRVQGVGFRMTTEQVARRFAVTGFVKNLPDGRVEVVAEGEPQELDRFEAAVADAMAGHITHTDRRESPARGDCPDFRITH